MKIKLSDVCESEMFNFISDLANDLNLFDEQASELEKVLDTYGFRINVNKSNSDYFQVYKK